MDDEGLSYEFDLRPDHRYLVNVGVVGEGVVEYDSVERKVRYLFAQPVARKRPPAATESETRNVPPGSKLWPRWLRWPGRSPDQPQAR